jgi:hypothetical protein
MIDVTTNRSGGARVSIARLLILVSGLALTIAVPAQARWGGGGSGGGGGGRFGRGRKWRLS